MASLCYFATRYENLRTLHHTNLTAMETAASTSGETSAVKATTAAAVESTGTCTRNAAAHRSRSGAKSNASRARSAINSAGIIRASNIVRARSPVAIVRAEMLVVRRVSVTKAAIAIEQRRVIHQPRGIKPPTERAIEDSIPRNKCVRAEPRIPVPVCAPPAWSPRTPSGRRIKTSGIHVRLGKISRSQTAPPVKISFLVTLLVELLRFQFAGLVQTDLMSALYRDILAGFLYLCLAIKDAQLRLLQIKVIQTGFEQRCFRSLRRNLQIVLGMDLCHLDHRLAFVQLNLRIGKARRNHLHRAIRTHSQEHAGCQQHLGLAICGCQGLTGLQLLGPDRFRVEYRIADAGLSLHVI